MEPKPLQPANRSTLGAVTKFAVTSRVIFYIICFIFAAACFFFSLSAGLFMWLMPDEPAATHTYKTFGLLGCTMNYYLHTPINRLSADFNVCTLAMTSTFFTSMYKGWVFARLMIYSLVPISIAYLLRQLMSVPFKSGLLIGLFVSAIAFFILNSLGYFIFGAGLSIYLGATITFFLLIALLPNSIENKKTFFLFCTVFAWNILCHESLLAVSGFIIPIFAWYRYQQSSAKRFFKASLHDPKVWALCLIYITCTLILIFSPGLKMRQSVWPVSGTFIDAIAYAVFSIENTIYLLVHSYPLAIVILLLGAVLQFSKVSAHLQNKKLLFALLFAAPVLYTCVTGILIGITPSLWWGGAQRSAAYHWLNPLFAHIVSNPRIMAGEFSIRQYAFSLICIYVDLLFLGYFITNAIRKRLPQPKNARGSKKRAWVLNGTLLIMILFMFSFHPDGQGSLNIISAMLKKTNKQATIDPSQFVPAVYLKAHPEGPILGRDLAATNHFKVFTSILFRRNLVNKHERGAVYVLMDKYLSAHRGDLLPKAMNDFLYSFPPMWHYPEPYKSQIFDSYGIFINK
ncbi:MAG: hypothetical protein COB66_08500 [Coxiella sp. (in: Bacteria)]|nr:MAG: hypothetical protein COB66_08500 [Coxiella sp. (in: g-proteobacteria)]